MGFFDDLIAGLEDLFAQIVELLAPILDFLGIDRGGGEED